MSTKDKEILNALKQNFGDGKPHLTKFGDIVIQPTIDVVGRGTFITEEWHQHQPRIKQLRKIFEEHIDYQNGDHPIVDEQGLIYSKTQKERDTNAPSLAQIDTDMENLLFIEANRQAHVAKIGNNILTLNVSI